MAFFEKYLNPNSLKMMLLSAFLLVSVSLIGQDSLLLQLMVRSGGSNQPSMGSTVLFDGVNAQYNPKTGCYELSPKPDRLLTIEVTELGSQSCTFRYYHSFFTNPRGMMNVYLGGEGSDYIRIGYDVMAFVPDSFHIGIAKETLDSSWKTDSRLQVLLKKLELEVDTFSLKPKQIKDRVYQQPKQSDPPFLRLKKKNGKAFAAVDCPEIIELNANGYAAGIFLGANSGLLTGPLTVEAIDLNPGSKEQFLKEHSLLSLETKTSVTYIGHVKPGLALGLVDVVNGLYENKYVTAVHMKSWIGGGGYHLH